MLSNYRHLKKGVELIVLVFLLIMRSNYAIKYMS